MKHCAVFVMLIVLLIAAALRMVMVSELPLGLHYDEAANVILARQIAAGTYRPVFIRAYTGKEVLFFYTGAFWVWATGGAPWGLRLNAAMFGVLTVAASYAVTYALFGPGRRARAMGLLAAAWMAVAFPHVLFSRYGFRAVSQPLLQALTITALWHGWRSGRYGWFAAGGMFLGLTAYTYLAARLFPLPLVLALGWLFIRSSGKERRRRLKQLGLTVLVAWLIFAPLGLYFLRNPAAFTTRIAQVAAPTWRDALRGVWLCVRALVWPTAGDPYIRFNMPGRPILDGFSAVWAGIGLIGLLSAARKDALDTAARLFVVAVLATMVLPSALATAEITPSHLRLIGLFPFIAILPAYGVVQMMDIFQTLLPARTVPNRPRLFTAGVVFVLGVFLIGGGLMTARTYRRWATSTALFYAADGEMVLAAQALDTLDVSHTTVYIASEHYRHPTVAALARQYAQAKWLTGGATLVLPPSGEAVYLLPRSLLSPTSWPDTITQQWQSATLNDPTGEPAVWVKRLTAAQIAALRPTIPPRDDFAHVVRLYDARLVGPCRVAEACPVFLTWVVGAPYSTLQPLIRWLHPETGEWTRTTAFHYPPEEWTVGDVVFDRFTLVPPVGIPPLDGYLLGVSFFNPDSGEVLPRLEAERFAGLEARFSAGAPLLPMVAAPDTAQADAACLGIPRTADITHKGVRLIGHTSLPDTLRPGETVLLRLCWQATDNSLPQDNVTLTLRGSEENVLYSGAPAGGYSFAQWPAGSFVEDRYRLRIPKTTQPGHYTLVLSVGETPIVTLGEIDIPLLARNFTLPTVQHPFVADFGGYIRLLGYDVAALRPGQVLPVTLHWQTRAEVAQDYLVFVHLLDVTSGRIITQVDEGPQNNTYPTSLWAVGEVVADRHTLTVPSDLPAGDYRLRVGFYRQEDGDYLPVNGEASVLLPLDGVQP